MVFSSKTTDEGTNYIGYDDKDWRADHFPEYATDQHYLKNFEISVGFFLDFFCRNVIIHKSDSNPHDSEDFHAVALYCLVVHIFSRC